MNIPPLTFNHTSNPMGSLSAAFENLGRLQTARTYTEADMMSQIATGQGDPNASLFSMIQNDALTGLILTQIQGYFQRLKSYLQIIGETIKLAARGGS